MMCDECNTPDYSPIDENYSTSEEVQPFVESEIPEVIERNTKTVEFSSLSTAEKQAWVDFCAHEIARHQQDIDRTLRELEYIKNRYKIEPRSIYVATWVLIK